MGNRTKWQPPRLREKLPNEVSVYTVATGNISLNPLHIKAQKEAINYIKGLDGFIGLYPCPPDGTLCLFKTKNDAKGAKNLMKLKGIPTGNNIGEVYIDKCYVEGLNNG